MTKPRLFSITVVFSAAIAFGPGPAYGGDRDGDARRDGRNEADSKWDITLGAGVFVGPAYDGSDDFEVLPFPLVDIEWNELIFLTTQDGLGFHAFRGEDLTISASVGFEPGRNDKDHTDLAGLGDIDPGAVAKLSFEYEIGPVTPFASISKYFGATGGVEAEFGIETMVPLAALTGGPMPRGDDGPGGPFLTFGVSAEWADKNYMGDTFGITAAQSAASGYAQHTAKAGFKSVGAELGIVYPLGDHWSVSAMFEYGRLTGDAADSPFVREKNQFGGGLFVAYRF